MQTILTVGHLFLAIGLISLVLMQHGKGADAGAAFGSGASATVFGARGSGNFLTRATGVMAALFFVTSMALAYFSSNPGDPVGLMDGTELPVAPAQVEIPMIEVPAVPSPVSDASVADAPLVPAPTEPRTTTEVPAVIPPAGEPVPRIAAPPLEGQPGSE